MPIAPPISRKPVRIIDLFGWLKRGWPMLALWGVALCFYAAHVETIRAAIMRSDPETVLDDPRLAPTALAIGKSTYAQACANCHGDDGRGSVFTGAPNLRDADHLYGSGLVAEIEEIASHGIRAGDSRGWTLASMPAYGRARPYDDAAIKPLTPGEIVDVAQYVRSLSGLSLEGAAVSRGGDVYQGRGGCWDCHGREGLGDAGIGAPRLNDPVWLYGDGSARSIINTISRGRAGVSPTFRGRVPPLRLRAVALYVASRQAPSSAPLQGTRP